MRKAKKKGGKAVLSTEEQRRIWREQGERYRERKKQRLTGMAPSRTERKKSDAKPLERAQTRERRVYIAWCDRWEVDQICVKCMSIVPKDVCLHCNRRKLKQDAMQSKVVL